jgi:hypothetical protein
VDSAQVSVRHEFYRGDEHHPQEYAAYSQQRRVPALYEFITPHPGLPISEYPAKGSVHWQSLLDIKEERFEREGQVPFSGFALRVFLLFKIIKKISHFIFLFVSLLILNTEGRKALI